MALRIFLFALVSLVLAPSVPAAPYKILVFSKTAGFRHASIPDGLQCVRRLGTNNNFTVDASENASVFTLGNLRQYRAVVFLMTTGDILDANQQAAFESYIRAGGGYVGVHSASDTEYNWPWYGQLVGAYFLSHPANQTATIRVADHVHPSTAHLPDLWVRFDEWYNLQTNPRGRVHVLATLDERTYAPGSGTMGFDHPIAWCHEFDGGRSWYTAGGHTSESYSEPLFQQHLLGGIEWATRVKDGDAGATSELNFRKVVLDATPANPMELAVAPDGRVFYIERAGRLKIYLPAQNQTVVAGMLSVDTGREDGLLGLALDPGFERNQWLYLFYSPAGATAKQHVSRFTMSGNVLDLGSEQVLLEIPTQRSQCCHSAGSLAFGADGNLFIATGDNTNPFDSNGYAPIDERPGRSAWDAQKSSASMDDLRGKILRIRPQGDGTYTIPPGNLFSGGNGRPEIYAMGCRNPFRISIDQRTGWLYWGDVGPDANAANALRGPAGQDEWNQARTAGNYGWPYFVGDNKAYIEYDFATSNSFGAYNPNAPTNNSPNNTGGQLLPSARPAWIWYPYGNSAEFPEVNGGGGRTAMAGPTYYFSSNLVSSRKLPAYYDRTLFIYEWSRNWLREVKLDGNGNILKINPFLPNFQFLRPMDLELGPDGALYLIEWGTSFNGNNADAKIVRLDYLPGKVESAPATTTLVPTGSTWKYLDNGSNQGTTWTGASFNDAAWKTGVGKFGTNDPATTRIEIGPVNNRWITTYFRHAFNVTNAGMISGLMFSVLRDDGVVVHLNGTEAFRMNMPGGAVNYQTLASATVGGADESRFYPTNISPALLQTANLLAVELHQSATNTSDAGFELSLTGTIPRNLHPAIEFQRSSGNLVLTWTAINFALESANDLAGPWTEISPTAPGSYSVSAAPGNKFFRLRRYP